MTDKRVALVTGGTRGIGAAIARSLAGAGAVVAVGYTRNDEAALFDACSYLTRLELWLIKSGEISGAIPGMSQFI